jgi:uridylate kinase
LLASVSGNKALAEPRFKRVLLKLSGESLAGEKKSGIEPDILKRFAGEIKKAHDLGVQLGLVIGGGNIFRGLSQSARDMDRVSADNMGMLATVINAIALRSALEKEGMKARVMSAIPMEKFADYFVQRAALNYLDAGEILIFAAGTGNPYFTTDTAAVLRAVEIKADLILKGTRVDGVYSADPEKRADAVRYDTLTFMDVINQGLKVMDVTAITLAMDNNLPIMVFNFDKADNLKKLLTGESIGTIVQG